MKKYRRIIFVCISGTCRSQMAAGIMRKKVKDDTFLIYSKGLIVLFPEPLNQKAEAVMISNGLETNGNISERITEEDFRDDTLVLVMEKRHKDKIYEEYENIKNVMLLTEAAGEQGDIVDPYGGPLTGYSKCYEIIEDMINKMIRRMEE